ncbi:MGDG synthase family glycosyltransferase [Desulfoluna spongiiphila]|uniref:MGDG synthase family glycosyltransferase n=1 Tax=Desulfoluna spongiiphila TaxID=419481 RepID=UPI00125A805F|nr:glycosyltransferase [Desulfoluna spongiiphila]VVS91562.1 diacylglycerol glucosyltransferase n-terminal [Desulfoluna spongiiphila]
MGKKRKLLVISVSIGSGHVRAAEAIRKTALRHCPELDVVHLDAMDYVSGAFRKAYKESYLKIIERHPSLWGYMFSKSDRAEDDDSKMKKVRLAFERLSSRALMDEIERVNPDGVLCTHFLPAGLISRKIRKGRMKIPCWVQVTDFDVHGLWFQHRMDGYFVACEEASWKLEAFGIDPSNIHITGIPIVPPFTMAQDKEACAAELGIALEKPTVLMMSGGEGLGDMLTLTERMLKADPLCQIIALAGKNEDLFLALTRLSESSGGRLIPMGFTNTIERMMAVSDIAVTKPGGLTSSECLAMALPMIIISPIPGQEERNADYLLEHGAAHKALDVTSLEHKLKRLMDRPDIMRGMKEKAGQIARPDAAAHVLDIVCEALERDADPS